VGGIEFKIILSQDINFNFQFFFFNNWDLILRSYSNFMAYLRLGLQEDCITQL
jgi:hypothetical protein